MIPTTNSTDKTPFSAAEDAACRIVRDYHKPRFNVVRSEKIDLPDIMPAAETVTSMARDVEADKHLIQMAEDYPRAYEKGMGDPEALSNGEYLRAGVTGAIGMAMVATAASAYAKIREKKKLSFEGYAMGGLSNAMGFVLQAGKEAIHKLNPITSALSGLFNGAAFSYNLNHDTNKDAKTKSIEAGISGAGAAGLSFAALKAMAGFAASSGAGMAASAATAVALPVIAGMGMAYGVKAVSDMVHHSGAKEEAGSEA